MKTKKILLHFYIYGKDRDRSVVANNKNVAARVS